MKAILAIALLLTSLFFNANSQCHIDDWNALKALYESAGGDNWYKNTGWEEVIGNVPTENCDLENLYGVALNPDGRVYYVGLENNQLTGHIPIEIGDLLYLDQLRLNNNNLTGNIPTELGSLSNLAILYANYNQLNGNLPIELGNLTNLIHLKLAFNNLSGMLPTELNNLYNLNWLEIYNNNFVGCYNNLTNLCLQFGPNNTFISNGNSFDASWEDYCTNGAGMCIQKPNCHSDDWIALKALYENTNGDNWLDKTGWDTMIDAYESSPANCDLSDLYGIGLNNNGRVNTINISSNQLSGNLPTELRNLINLKVLDLNNNLLTGMIPYELCGLHCLEQLKLHNNQLMGNIPAGLGSLPNLHTIFLQNNSFSGCYDHDLSNLCILNQICDPCIDISSGNNFDTDFENDFCTNEVGMCPLIPNCHIDDWTALKTLYENTNGNNWLNNSGWDTLIEGHTNPPANCDLAILYGVDMDNSGRVMNLNLEYNHLFGSLNNNLNLLSNLKILNLFYNTISGCIPQEIGDLIYLTSLNLGYNILTGNIPPEIGNLSNLTTLGLNENSFSVTIPSEIGNLSNLNILNLSNNKLIGSIPTEIENLSGLSDLSLGSNNLTGEIPVWIGNLFELTNLYLNFNNFSGEIPTTIGNLTSLTNLGLCCNNLNGNIPNEIANLPNLLFIDLSGNDLVNQVPNFVSTNLNYLNLIGNKLTGQIPYFQTLNFNFLSLHLVNNYFSCEDMLNIFNNYPGFVNPGTYCIQNFGNVQSLIIDTNIINYTLQQTLPTMLNNPAYQWKKNETNIYNDNNPTLTLNNIQPNDAGIYTLHINDDCMPEMYFNSDPIYVIYPGYDLYGQPVEYNQIMVEFDSPESTQYYEDLLLSPNASFVIDSCNCNRELYLWQFPSTDEAAAALLEIDKKHQTIKEKNDVDGGFNNYINVGNTDNEGTAYNVLCNMTNSYPDDVTIYVLDTGLDLTGISNTPYLMPAAPVDNCHPVSPSSGYSYTGTYIDDNYEDEHGHGTYSVRAITDELVQQPNNIDLVPLKIFDENGEGNLFDLVCGIYHAIDHGGDIINISAGYRGQRSSILERAVNTARENGVFICTAAGNDTLNIDQTPQYPACFAGQYHYDYNDIGDIIDSTRYDNIISITAINAQNNLLDFANFGQHSVTMSAYGGNIHSYGLGGLPMVWSGTSMATYFVTRELALEIASNKNRPYQQIWSAFENNSLVDNAATFGKTITEKQLNVSLEDVEISGCTNPCNANYNEYATIDDGSCAACCNSNARLANPKRLVIERSFARFAQHSFTNNFIKAERAYIKYSREIHRILTSNDQKNVEVRRDFEAVKDLVSSILYQTFTTTKSKPFVNSEHLQLINQFLVSLSKVTQNQDLKFEIKNIRKYMHIMKGKEVKHALIDFDEAGLENDNIVENIPQIEDNFDLQLINTVGHNAYLIYQSSLTGIVNINLFNVEGKTVSQLFQQTIDEGKYQYKLSKQHLARGIYYVQVNFDPATGDKFHEVLKLSVIR